MEKEYPQLDTQGEYHYYNIRARFNKKGDPLDILYNIFNGISYVMNFVSHPRLVNKTKIVQTTLFD
jgi:DNA adenine methylase